MAALNLSRNTYGESVKHMECPFYFEPKGCRKTAARCLYAHHRTGQRAGKPQHVDGFGSVAGGNLSRARAQRCQRTLQPWRSGTGSQTPSPEPQRPDQDSSSEAAGSPTLTPGSSPSIDGRPPARTLCAKCQVSAPEGGFCPAPGCGAPRRQASRKEPLPSPPPPDKSDDDSDDDWDVGAPLTTPDWFEALLARPSMYHYSKSFLCKFNNGDIMKRVEAQSPVFDLVLRKFFGGAENDQSVHGSCQWDDEAP
ncbi:hypothetical protein LTR70_003823 [Exophiala xenobiotica]|uniref:C3H1-type domain-containing protein n=1 Tax=Lithohypha guttulata TaxID=1690604 RepID=A0ABR0KF35_9EURO|nr:hypothetical protein LTR24_003311 [Lithohypha guttulata]KAK5322321.1 hypothetical protein LTR70_003823 [Exophiala xenobiotica]